LSRKRLQLSCATVQILKVISSFGTYSEVVWALTLTHHVLGYATLCTTLVFYVRPTHETKEVKDHSSDHLIQ